LEDVMPAATASPSNDRKTGSGSWADRLRAERVTPSDPWSVTLDTIKGRVGSDGVERISTEMVFEWLDVPPFKRTPELAERIRGSMVRRGWVPVRARHVTGKGYAARVRGYARLASVSSS
jgi:hypothetical protein